MLQSVPAVQGRFPLASALIGAASFLVVVHLLLFEWNESASAASVHVSTTNSADDEFEYYNKRKSKPIFTLLADTRSGSEWILSTLQHHHEICDKLPSDAMQPNGMPWLPDDSETKSCSFAFIRDHVLELLTNATEDASADDIGIYTPSYRCTHEYNATNDPVGADNLCRLCRFVEQLGNYRHSHDSHHNNRNNYDHISDRSDEHSMMLLWLEAVATGNHELHPCACPASKLKPIKIMTDWAPYLPLFDAATTTSTTTTTTNTANALGNHKVVRLKRRNTFARYLSELIAQKTQLWHFESPQQKVDERARLADTPLEISLEHMVKEIRKLQAQDAASDEWVQKNKNAMDVLELEYETCRDGATHCFAQLFNFLGVKADDASLSRATLFATDFSALVNTTGASQLLDVVANSAHVLEALGALGWGDSFPQLKNYQEMHHVVYEPDKFVRVPEWYEGIQTTVLDSTATTDDRSQAIVAALEQIPVDALVVVSDSRTKVSSYIQGRESFYAAMSDFRSSYQELTRKNPGAVIALVDSPLACCSASQLGSSNEVNVLPLAGKALDVLNVFRAIGAFKGTDQVALERYKKRNPRSIVRDNDHKMFGQCFVGFDAVNREACSAKLGESSITTTALFLHDASCTEAAEHHDAPRYPMWNDDKGISAQPLLDHISRLSGKGESLKGVDLYFGPEILYIITKDGLWSSLGDRDKSRIQPTDKLMKLALDVLLRDGSDQTRWRALYTAVQTTGVPYLAWYGDYKGCSEHNYLGNSSIPLFTACATVGCDKAYPTPSYMTFIESKSGIRSWHKTFQHASKKYPFESKQRKVVWRGGLSESEPDKVRTSVRWRVAELAHKSQSGLLDVGLTNIPDYITKSAGIDAAMVGGLADSIAMSSFQSYIGVLDMDGNSWSSRFGTVVLKVVPNYVDHFHYELIPWKHYIPVQTSLSDLEENVAFVSDPQNELRVKEIVATANQWCAERMVREEQAKDMLDMWQDYVVRLTLNDSGWGQEHGIKNVRYEALPRFLGESSDSQNVGKFGSWADMVFEFSSAR